MYVCAYDSEYAIVSLEGKSLKLIEVSRPKMNPEYAVVAISNSGKEEVICKFEYKGYCIRFLTELSQRMQNKTWNPSYVRLFNGHPDKAIFG